jgi:DNA replication and repair protein RecF
LKIVDFKIRNFRNIKKLDILPGPGLNILVGDNAQGKTNLLESIYILSTGTSFRTGKDINFVQYNSESYSIYAKYTNQERKIESLLKYKITAGKVFEINGKKVKSSDENNIRVVLFTPDDLYLIKGSPNRRRNFLDFALRQVSADYIMQWENYNKILKKRNILLKKQNIDDRAFSVINDIFIETAVQVIIKRINFVNILDDLCQKIFPLLNSDKHIIKIRYALSFPVFSGKINHEILLQTLKEQVLSKKNDELMRGTTMIGPHLDDLNIYLDDNLARLFSSQGQQRNIAVTLKLAEIYAFKQIKGYYPLFLLDEVFAELDEAKKNLLMEQLSKAKFQSFLSSVSIDNIKRGNSQIFKIKNGCII